VWYHYPLLLENAFKKAGDDEEENKWFEDLVVFPQVLKDSSV